MTSYPEPLLSSLVSYPIKQGVYNFIEATGYLLSEDIVTLIIFLKNFEDEDTFRK